MRHVARIAALCAVLLLVLTAPADSTPQQGLDLTDNNKGISGPLMPDNGGCDVSTLSTAWVPILKFGGATTGITYTAETAYYAQCGNLTIATFRITLSSKGTATGTATITGLATAPLALAGGSCGYFASMASLNYNLLYYVDTSGNINLLTGGTTGTSTLSDVNFTNSSDLLCTIAYVSAL